MSSLIGPDGVLWHSHRAFAVVLASSVPSGLPHVVQLRDDIRRSAFHTQAEAQLPSSPASLRHQSSAFGGAPPLHVYVGNGYIDCQSRPAMWANPYWFIAPAAHDILSRFIDYLDARADLVSLLALLAGKV